MFSRSTDASKVALVALVYLMQQHGYEVIDCQVESAHLNSMGARNIPRLDFEQYLAQTSENQPDQADWQLDISAGELL
jgi:leucyl/phenylalanyl-tRNA--protein transferase